MAKDVSFFAESEGPWTRRRCSVAWRRTLTNRRSPLEGRFLSPGLFIPDGPDNGLRQNSVTPLPHPPFPPALEAQLFFAALRRSNDSAVMSSSNRRCEFDSSDQSARRSVTKIKLVSPSDESLSISVALHPRIYFNRL